MFRIANETVLKDTFRELDRDEVVVPAELRFPLGVKDYIAWLEPSGHRAYLVFIDPASDKPMGIVFHRPHAKSEGINHMCEWCHCVRGSGGVGLMTAIATSRRRVGIELCTDLGCKDKIKSPPGINDIRESLDPAQRVERVLKRMSDFARRNLI
ncbi:MAG TPA: FBP domain-containing protein [Bdellovibrionales bacterium]|nr:FBP domain-containing protein [Bdellovibrionales bacterium]